MRWRKLETDKGTFDYCVGTSNTVIKKEGKRVDLVPNYKLKKLDTPDRFKKNKYKRTETGMILPSDVLSWIEEHF